MCDDIIKLVSVTRTTNEYGDIVETPVERTVYAQLESVWMSEFYKANAVGLKAEVRFILSDYLDYHNEQTLKYKGFADTDWQEYKIIRAPRKGLTVELVCQRGVD